MFKAIRAISKLVLLVAALNVFAFCVYHVNNGGTKLGPLTKPLKSFSQFPKLVMGVFRELTMPTRLIGADESFKRINKLDYDLYGLNAHFGASAWNIELRNFKNDELVHNWKLENNNFQPTGTIFSHAEPISPILLANKNIVLNNHETKNLYRLDENSKILWHNTDYQYHHSISLAEDGNIWGCTRTLVELKNKIRYWDNYITKVDVETGKTIFHKSISEILIENEMDYLIHGFGNEVYEQGTDPLHHNEIEPVMEDGTYWKKGDLFLSFRHRSMVILYRPSSNKVIRLIQGPFVNSHDVDIHSDSTITIFNNNISSLANLSMEHVNFDKAKELSDLSPDLNLHAGVIKYNFKDSTFTDIYPAQFSKEKIYTPTQGLHEFLSNGDLFVENYQMGLLYVFNEQEIKLKTYANKVADGGVEPPHWVRIYESIDFTN